MSFRTLLPAPARPARGVIAALAVAVAAGCAAGPDYRAPDAGALVPAAYATADAALSGGAPAERWWTALGDPVLDELIARGLAGNPDLAAAEARVRQTRALARAAGATRWPEIGLDARAGRDKLSRNGENLALIPFTPPTTQFTDYRIGFDASWEIDLAGHTRREIEAAAARAGSSVESRNDARVVVAAEIADAYVDYRVAGERLAVARRNLAALDETLRLVTLEAQAGVASEADLNRVAAERLDAAGTVPSLEAAQHSAAFRLAALTGETHAALAARLEPPRPTPAVPELTPVGLPSELLRRRPDVRRAERELAAATADVGTAVAAQFPRLALLGDFGWDSVRSGDLTNAASRYWNAGPQLTLPLLAPRLHAQVDAAKAARDAALAGYRATVLRAFADTESSLVGFASERRREAALAAAARSLDSTLSLERRRYEAGDASLVDVLAAQRSADQAADLHSASTGQLLRDYIALGKALGGGWQIPN